MSTAAAVQSTPAGQAAAFTRALARAQRAGTIAFKVAPGVYEVPSASAPGTLHTVQFVGPSWSDWSCTCPARTVCVHKTVALFCARHGVSAVRPAPVLCANCHDAVVSVAGDWCEGCVNLKHSEPIPFPVERARCPICGMNPADKLHDVVCG